jgi:hypothetical protein
MASERPLVLRGYDTVTECPVADHMFAAWQGRSINLAGEAANGVADVSQMWRQSDHRGENNWRFVFGILAPSLGARYK